MTFDEFVNFANLSLARTYFPANSDEESLQMLHEYTEKYLRSADSPPGGEQQNCFDRHAGYETLVLEWRDCQ